MMKKVDLFCRLAFWTVNFSLGMSVGSSRSGISCRIVCAWLDIKQSTLTWSKQRFLVSVSSKIRSPCHQYSHDFQYIQDSSMISNMMRFIVDYRCMIIDVDYRRIHYILGFLVHLLIPRELCTMYARYTVAQWTTSQATQCAVCWQACATRQHLVRRGGVSNANNIYTNYRTCCMSWMPNQTTLLWIPVLRSIEIVCT